MKLTLRQKIAYRTTDKVINKILISKVKKWQPSKGVTSKKRSQPIIVSFTSYPARFNDIELCIKSLLWQTVKPDRIILWLGSDSVDTDLSNLKKYEEYGLEIHIDKDNNYKSHKKYLYCLSKFPDALNITVDDDLIYQRNMIKSLLDCHEKYPTSIIARRVHKIQWLDENNPEVYTKWIGECNTIKTPSFSLLPTTGAGTLYPPDSLYSDYNNIELIQKFAINADDIWMKFMSVMKRTTIVWAKSCKPMPAIINEDDNQGGLKSTNVTGENDIYFRNLLQHYHLSKRDFE